MLIMFILNRKSDNQIDDITIDICVKRYTKNCLKNVDVFYS